MIAVKKIKRDKKKKSVTVQDPQAKPIFCELSELDVLPSTKVVWKETARLLKFIEVVEASGRWSAPFVATVSLRNVIELRSCLSRGLIVLNQNGKELGTVFGSYSFFFFFFFDCRLWCLFKF